MRFSTIADVTGGILRGQDGNATTFSTDTRQLSAGDFFVALSGENFDANAFVLKAAEQGASGALVSRLSPDVPLPQIVVTDTREALGRLARAWREQFDPVRVAITGSSGKTTTKEMVASIFRQAGETLATLGNKNNEIGVPLTLLRLQAGHQYGVFELGANHRGEIAYTSGLVQPHAAVINNVGTAHLEGFGSRQGIAEAKGEIFSGLMPGGVAVINLDDDFADYHRSLNTGRRILTFSVNHAADVTASGARMLPGGAWAFDLHLDGQVLPVALCVLGRHNVGNALAAAALALACGIPPEKIRTGLEDAKAAPGRLELHTCGNLAVIDDTYNANPGSMKAAIDMLAACDGRRIAILGGMGELGDGAPELHADVGRYAREQGLDLLLAVGHFHEHTLRGFGEGAVQGFATQDELLAALPAIISGPATVLVKGSRSARMERVVQKLIEERR
ncbi:UDP-N-acetylmuramoyl-tripeptide--D-alanyl-D-alanine ligase [Fluviicoccus keumensis]|uniref:UDP-N-acetylmuramoyl-tripeptide--D-alanyl-D-alanine ligase n=1 Tax=Fluviicoccus keumensis TaxID=1435465 RepID=A0A4Q7YFY5_9GAMM|nr:UDP-N-acetylmuramoyl-tripeptide--D-alanyl-D-alanine ligase [Fluviicoccus keumensis]RZU35371.1 UDP-N-acetylmuramoyl-tripeptide--D-alanyl-D-alanine ligase [Fluviicoccus keumensis]